MRTMPRKIKKPREVTDPAIRVLRIRGLMREIADTLGIKPQAPYTWDRVPAEHVPVVHEISGLPLNEIRPDIYKPGSRLSIYVKRKAVKKKPKVPSPALSSVA
jgi:hypothetical protein